MDLTLADQHPLLTPFCIRNLKRYKIETVNQFLKTKIEDLKTITGYSIKNLQEIRNGIIEALNKSCVDLSNAAEETRKYSTGLSGLNGLLSGGLEAGSLNEFIGFTASGKTFLTQTICLRLLCEYDELCALIITNSSPQGVERSLCSICESLNIEPDDTNYLLKKIKLTTFSNITKLHEILNSLLSSPVRDLLVNHKIILLDGLSSEFLKHFSEYDKVFYSQVYSCVQILRRLANDFAAIVLITNLTMTRNEVGLSELNMMNLNHSEVTDKNWPSFMDNRFSITRPPQVLCEPVELIIRILKSRHLSTTNQSCTLSITERGLIE